MVEMVVFNPYAKPVRQGLLDADAEKRAMRATAVGFVQRNGREKAVAQPLPVVAGAAVQERGGGQKIPRPDAGAEIEVGPDLLGIAGTRWAKGLHLGAAAPKRRFCAQHPAIRNYAVIVGDELHAEA